MTESPVTPKNSSDKIQRTNVERAAETQEKIINAAIDSIFDVGYEGTSLKMVADRAGVSKGAAQHHFPTKTDLMLSVAETCLRLHSKIRHELLMQYPLGKDRMDHIPDVSWEIINHPSYTALIEIMMATRNNDDLKRRFTPLIEYIAAERDAGEKAFCNDFNIEPNEPLQILIRTHVTAMRGIAVGLMFNPDKKTFREELDMMRKYERLMTDLIIKEYSKKD
ncbi:MAG: TetR/AcrR family transcriptional regulator [Cellvibrionaceae bacterium]